MPLNPYFNQDFIGFFWVLAKRLAGFFSGSLTWQNLASDEVQIIVLIGVALSSALVGGFLVLRRMSMLANALSHTILLGIVLAFLFTRAAQGSQDSHSLAHLNLAAMLVAAALTGLVTTFLTQLLTNVIGLQEDASIGFIFTSLFALGIVFVTLFTRNAHIGTEVIMGNADGLHKDDCKLILIIFALNASIFTLLFKEFTITTFDPQLAKSLGISTVVFNYLLMLQTSITSIGAFRAVGVIMVLAFMTGPPLTARLLVDRLKHVIWISLAIGSFASILGVASARHALTVYNAPLSTGGMVVCLIVAAFLLAALFSPKQGILARWFLRKRIKRQVLK